FVHLSGTSVPILVVPEVDVVLTVHRLHAEPATDLHGMGIVLPLLKGNIRVGESVPDGRLSDVRRGDGGRVPRRAELAFWHPVGSVEELLRTPWRAHRGE